ncbi:MAG: protease-4 [Oceanicoccus sp.]|jgi:protease-4
MEEKPVGFIRCNYRRLMKLLSALRLLLTNLVFLLLVIMVVIFFSATNLPAIPEKSALVLNISGSLVDQKAYADPISQLMGQDNPEQQETLLQDVIDAIRYATTDDRINILVLSLDNMLYGGVSKMQEIVPVLDAFRASGKKIIAVGDYFSQDQYWLAAQADEIYIDPMGGVVIDGYGLYRNYFKQALDKLHINFHVFRVGEFKSAMEPFMRDDMSAQAKRASQQWLDKLWYEYTHTVAQRRNLDIDDISSYANGIDKLLEKYQGNTASVAIASGLVDGVKTRDEINSYLLELVGAADEDGYFQGIGFKQYLWLQQANDSEPKAEQKVGILVAAGNIVDGDQPAGMIGGDSLAALIRQARLDAEVRAVVLRIDSGGGSAFASEIIRRELQLLKQEGKPLVVSMGAVAASGGYWIAADADEIWATPATLTGSIGIFAAFPTLEGSLDKLGIHTDGIGTTIAAGSARIDRPLQPIAARSIQSVIEYGYNQFLDVVASGRGLSKDAVAELAEGRVWSAADAHRLGLVDQLGSLDQAVAAAAKLAELDDYSRQLIEIPLSQQEQLLQQLLGQAQLNGWSLLPVSSSFAQVQRWLRPLQDSLQFVSSMNDPQGVYLHCTVCVAP